MLATHVTNSRVEAVVDDGDHTQRVAQEGTPPGDGVEDGVQSQPGGLRIGSPQALLEAQGASYRQTGQVCDAGAVTQVVGEAPRGDDGLAAGQVGQGGIFEGNVFERVAVEAGEGVQLRGVGKGRALQK